jgi:hypothetical protein
MVGGSPSIRLPFIGVSEVLERGRRRRITRSWRLHAGGTVVAGARIAATGAAKVRVKRLGISRFRIPSHVWARDPAALAEAADSDGSFRTAA